MHSSPSLVVIGGSGFLGAMVVLRALASGAERVVSIARNPGKFPRVEDPRLERVELDATQEELVHRELARLAVPRVILCAAMARVDECERAPARAMTSNGLAPRFVAQACAEIGARLVHVSTDLVFGRKSPARRTGFTENDATAPISVYGESKLLGETLALSHGKNVLVARLPLLYGDSLGRGLGATDGVVAAVMRGEKPTLFADEWRTPLNVVDAADGLLELLELEYTGVLHLAGPERIDRARIGLAALTASGVGEIEARSKIVIGSRATLVAATLRPGDVSLDASRARAMLSTRLRTVRESLQTPSLHAGRRGSA